MTTPYAPYEIHRAGQDAPYLLICDHATNTVPDFVNDGALGVLAADMNRHIAFDIGAAAVTRQLSKTLNAPAILSNFSRLVIDPNRGEDDPTLVMQLYDGTIIPANRHLSADNITLRLNNCYRPYHDALAGLAAAHPKSVLVSIHSFTPKLNGRGSRPWHIGVLYAGDDRLARPLLKQLASEADICAGDNEPYSGHLAGDTMDRHGVTAGRQHVLIEIRNDLIANAGNQQNWANRLALILQQVLNTVDP